MNRIIKKGYPLLADISGFVDFLKDSEIDHAREIIHELLEFLIKKLSPVFTIAQIDGDAIFAFAPQEHITRSESLFELLESTYTLYKDQLVQVSRVRSCGCNACRNASNLDLKFAVHFGEYIPHEINNQFDLTGLAPYFIRKREWKEPVQKATHWRGYALFTQDCLTQLRLHPDDLNAIEIPDGSTKTFGLDLESRYESMLKQRSILVTREDALYSFNADFPVSPTILWEWLNDPEKRTQWFILKWSARSRPSGRTKAGAVNHCNHGIGDSLETILDWHPFEYYTSEFMVRPFNIRMQQTSVLEAISDDKTRLHVTIKPADKSAGWPTKFTCKLYARYEKYVFKRLNRLIAASE